MLRCIDAKLKCKQLQIFIVLSTSAQTAVHIQQISSHTASVWWNYCMIATEPHSSSVNKPRRTVWHSINAYHLMVTLLAARQHCAADISYCSTCFDEIPQCVLTSPCTHDPTSHHSHHGDITQACDAGRGEKLYWESAEHKVVSSCLFTGWVKDQLV